MTALFERNMNANYVTIALVLMAAIVLLVYLIRRNRKDEKEFEADLNKEGTENDVHKGKGEST
jgi:preprotein translocase subunit YajC